MASLSNLPSTTDDPLLDGLSPGDLYRYSRTCKDAQDAVSSYIKRKFKLHKVLERYFEPDEILQFRELQSSTGMFISGSTALQFFEREEYPASDLDIYVEHRLRRPIAYWLKSIGYTLLPPPFCPLLNFEGTLERICDDMSLDRVSDMFHPQNSKGYSNTVLVLDFLKTNPKRKIQLVTSHLSPVQQVLNFHSTCVMNLITHENAYSFFPRATFDERRSMIYLPAVSQARRNALQKYAARGWAMVNSATEERINAPESAFCPGKRHLGDSKCWTLPIFPRMALRKSYMESNSWHLVYNAKKQPEMVYTIFHSTRLCFSYLVVDDALRAFIINKMRHLKKQSPDTKFLDLAFEPVIKGYRDLLEDVHA